MQSREYTRHFLVCLFPHLFQPAFACLSAFCSAGAIIHCTYKKSPVNIGNFVSIAHNAIIHGCTIHDNVLIGMGAIVMDDAVIESNSIIAAGALVSKNTIVKSGTVYAGVPAKKIKDIDSRLMEGEIQRIAKSYSMYAGWYEK